MQCSSLSAGNSAARPPWWATKTPGHLLRIIHVSESTRSRHWGRVLSLSAVALLFVEGCVSSNQHNLSPILPRDINAVLADHDQELLALPGVVGVYVGLMKDDKTPCLKVMLARKDPGLERAIPRTLEGHPVVTEVTGEMRPLQ